MTDVTYSVHVIRRGLFRFEYVASEKTHFQSSASWYELCRGYGFTEARARHKATAFIRRRKKALSRPVEAYS